MLCPCVTFKLQSLVEFMIKFTSIMKRSRGVMDSEMIDSNDFGIMGGWSLHCKGLSN